MKITHYSLIESNDAKDLCAMVNASIHQEGFEPLGPVQFGGKSAYTQVMVRYGEPPLSIAGRAEKEVRDLADKEAWATIQAVLDSPASVPQWYFEIISSLQGTPTVVGACTNPWDDGEEGHVYGAITKEQYDAFGKGGSWINPCSKPEQRYRLEPVRPILVKVEP